CTLTGKAAGDESKTGDLSAMHDATTKELMDEQVPPPSEYFCKKEVGGYTVYIYSLDAKIEDVEPSPYTGMYGGTFYIATYLDEKRVDSCVYEVLGDNISYFNKGFDLNVTDYDKDGREDFALGNRLSSNGFVYKFYSVDKDGKLLNLLDQDGTPATIYALTSEFSPLFENGENEKTVHYLSDDQFVGEERKAFITLQYGTEYVNQSEESFAEEDGENVAVTKVSVDSSDEFGADMPEVLYVDEDCLIVTFYKGVFVYDKTNHKLIRSLDRSAIGCECTQGDDYTEVVASSDGNTVYLNNRSKDALYIYDVDNDMLTKKTYKDNLTDHIDEFKNYTYTKTVNSDDEYSINTHTAWYYNPAGSEKIYTTIKPFVNKPINLAYREAKDVEYIEEDEDYECIFKDEGNRSVVVTGLSGNKLTFRNLACIRDLLIDTAETKKDDLDEAYYTGKAGVGPEMTTNISSDVKYLIYDGKYNSDGLEQLSAVSEDRFGEYVKKDLKRRDTGLEIDPNVCKPIYRGIPFTMYIRNGKCVKLIKWYEP
ncbi:MAG: hypothetical protein K6A38_08275, partial [Lachnospiraceae bacterium]|nr:hypothetical protein [Lachnospiraceae bacterium]